jgi:hypothetical protein
MEKKWEYSGTVHQLFIVYRKVCNSGRSEALYILNEFGMELVRLTNMYFTEIYSKGGIRKNLSDAFPIQNGLKQRDALSPLHFNLELDYTVRKVQKSGVTGNEWNTSAPGLLCRY